MWTMMTSPYYSVGVVDVIEWACVLCGHCFKMTEWVGQQLCIKFCVKFEHSSTEATGMIQKAAAVGNWWLAASSRQRVHSCMKSHAEFFGKTSNYPDDSASLQPRFVALRLLGFPETKISVEREEIWLWMKFRKIWQSSLWRLGELCEVPRCLLWRGLASLSCVQDFSYLLQ